MLSIDAAEVCSHRVPWNKGRLIGQKRPLKPKEIWAIRVRLQLEERRRDLALFNLALDSKLRGCELVRLQVNEVCVGGRVRDRATVIQGKPADRSSSKSPNKPEQQSAIGSPIAFQGTGSTSSRAAFMTNRTSRHDNTLASSTVGSIFGAGRQSGSTDLRGRPRLYRTIHVPGPRAPQLASGARLLCRATLVSLRQHHATDRRFRDHNPGCGNDFNNRRSSPCFRFTGHNTDLSC
jgi:hypothetical protein